MSTAFEDMLARDGVLIYRTRGVSMEPMLRQDRDLVVIRPPVSRLRKYDVALYKRGKCYVLHRVIRALDDRYLIRGDNTYVMETVPDSAVVGVLTGFQRKGRQISVENRAYQLYARFWYTIYPLRLLCIRMKRLAGRILRKLGLYPLPFRGRGKTT